MRYLMPLLLAVAAGCPNAELVPVEGGGEGPELLLDGGGASADLVLLIEASGDALRADPGERSSLVSIELTAQTFLGVCDDCEVVITATATGPDGETATDEVTVTPGQRGALSLELDDAFAGCETREHCAFEVPVRVTLDSDAYVTLQTSAWASVWVRSVDGMAPEGASVELRFE